MTDQPTGVQGPPKARGPIKGPLRIVFGIIKGLCIILGLPLTILCLMALMGLATGNGWARSIVAILVAIVVPIVVVDRLLPDEGQERAKGLPTDMLALIWMLVPVVFLGAAHGATQRVMAVEGDRLGAAGWTRISRAAYWLAAVEPVPPKLGGGASRGSGGAAATKSTPGTSATPTKPATPGKAAPADKGTEPAPAAARADAGAGASAKRDGSSPRDAASKPDAKPKKLEKFTPAELFRRCAPSVVSIKITGPRGTGGGTGFIIGRDGTVATNSHVIHGATAIQVKLKDGTWVKKVDLLEENEDRDLALLQIKTDKPLKPLPLGDSAKVTVGEKVISIGNPLGLDYTLTDGLISARRVYQGKKWIQMSAPVSPGNSGGPLFNMHGQVIGITTRVVAWFRAQNLNLAVPINELKKMLKSSYPKRRAIGAENPGTW